MKKRAQIPNLKNGKIPISNNKKKSKKRDNSYGDSYDSEEEHADNYRNYRDDDSSPRV